MIIGKLPHQWPPFQCERCELETAGWVWEDGTKIGSLCKSELGHPGEYRGPVIEQPKERRGIRKRKRGSRQGTAREVLY